MDNFIEIYEKIIENISRAGGIPIHILQGKPDPGKKTVEALDEDEDSTIDKVTEILDKQNATKKTS